VEPEQLASAAVAMAVAVAQTPVPPELLLVPEVSAVPAVVAEEVEALVKTAAPKKVVPVVLAALATCGHGHCAAPALTLLKCTARMTPA